MTLRIPLAVRLHTGSTERIVTTELRNLNFRSVVPGGFASARFSLDRPLATRPDDVDYYSHVYVYDTRSGMTVWEGRLEDPGRSASSDGQVWELSAVGPSAHAQDTVAPLIYVDQSLTPYIRVDNSTPAGTFSVATDPGLSATPDAVAQSLVFGLPQGLSLFTSDRVTARYDQLRLFGQKLARYDYTWDAGRTDANLRLQAVTRLDGSSTAEASRNDTFNTAGAGSSPRVIVTDFPAGRNTLDFRLIFGGANGTQPADDTWWTSVTSPIVLATRYSAAGSELLTAASYTHNYVLANEVVADLLGRLLPRYDGANAQIAIGTHQIDALAYPDGVTPDAVLTDLMALEPAYWAAWESNTAGLHRFEWTVWPTSVRYEADVDMGYQSQASADGLYDRVKVRWKGPAGEPRINTRTQTVPALTAAGLSRTALVDLGDQVGSSANADKAGDNFLAAHLYPANAGRLTIAEPIVDRVTGRMVQPWEIRPGNLIRVRGVMPSVDSLNTTVRDGATVFRVVSHEYDAGAAAATLELDSYSLSTARALSDLARQASATRR